MGPTPIQIVVVIVVALVLFGAGRLVDLGSGTRAAKKATAAPVPATEAPRLEGSALDESNAEGDRQALSGADADESADASETEERG